MPSAGVGIFDSPNEEDRSVKVCMTMTAPKKVKSMLEDKKAARRHQGKLNQRKYRAQKKNYMTRLDFDVGNLAMDVMRLRGKLQLLQLAVPPSLRTFSPELNITKENFRLFAQGISLDSQDKVYAIQRDFLKSVMHPDLQIMGCVGVGKLLEQGRLYVKTFDSVRGECVSVHVVSFEPQVVVNAQVLLHLRISRNSIRTVFPHLLNNEPLVQKLVGRTMTLPVQYQFTFDGKFQVLRMDLFSNPIVALMNLLQNGEETLAVHAGSLLTDNAELPHHL
ncbi:unnamed protein product [Aphanomyces euteiches]